MREWCQAALSTDCSNVMLAAGFVPLPAPALQLSIDHEQKPRETSRDRCKEASCIWAIAVTTVEVGIAN